MIILVYLNHNYIPNIRGDKILNKNILARSNYSGSSVRMIKVGALTLQFWLFMLLIFSFPLVVMALVSPLLLLFSSEKKVFSRIYFSMYIMLVDGLIIRFSWKRWKNYGKLEVKRQRQQGIKPLCILVNLLFNDLYKGFVVRIVFIFV